MGKIVSTSTNRFGLKKKTEVRTNNLEDFAINTVGRLFGKGREWRLVHLIERRKLRKSHGS
jgi:hypothetical protein